MPSERPRLRFLLDEHPPQWLADDLGARGVDTVALVDGRPELRGADDRRGLESAMAEGRIVVTEDGATFSAAIALVPDHLGVGYCHHARFPRTRPGLHRLGAAIRTLVDDPPCGLGRQPVVRWLDHLPD